MREPRVPLAVLEDAGQGKEGPAMKPFDDFPRTQCPKCGEWVEDADGFGVLRHEKCGYCAHPSCHGTTDGWVCDVCGAKVAEMSQ